MMLRGAEVASRSVGLAAPPSPQRAHDGVRRRTRCTAPAAVPSPQRAHRRVRRCAAKAAAAAADNPQPQPQQQQQQTVVVADAAADFEDKYNKQMQRQMGWDEPYAYHYERGLYWHKVYPRLIVGTQPRSPSEVADLHAAGVGAIVDLQRDEDKAYWGVDGGANYARAAELGISVARPSIADFSADSLRHRLPDAVRAVARALDATAASGRSVYVHCTAGLGRAPAVAIAYLYWLADGPPKYNALDDAYAAVTSVRPCGPRKDAIRAATSDVMRGTEDLGFDRRPPHAYAYLSDDDRARIRRQLLGA